MKNEFLNNIFEYSPIGIFKADKNKNITESNKAFAKILGHNSPEKVFKMNLDKDVFFENSGFDKILAQKEDKNHLINSEALWKNSGGKQIWVQLQIHIDKDDNGKMNHYEGYAVDITENKKNESSLKESELLFRKIFESSPVGIITLDTNGKFLSTNKAFRKIIGYPENEIQDITFLDITHQDDKIGSYILFQRLIKGEREFYRIETRFLRKNRTFVWVHKALSVFRDPSDNKTLIVGTVQDITEKVNSEKFLKYKEEYYHTLLDNSTDIITILEPDLTIRYQSPSIEEIAGYKKAELIGENFFNYAHHNEVNELVKFFHSISFSYDSTFPIQMKFLSKKGYWLYLEGSINNLVNNPFVRGFVINLRDTTDRELAYEKLKESEERFRELAENIRDAFTIFSYSDNKILYVSPAYKDIWGSTVQSLYKDPVSWMRKIYPVDFTFVKNAFQNLKSAHSFNIEYRIIKSPGKIRWIRHRVYPIKDKNNIIYRYTSIAEDITEQKLSRDQIRKLSHAVQQNPALIMITDPSGKIEYVNPKFTQITGYTLDEIIGKTPSIFKSGFTTKEEYDILWKTIKSGGTWKGELKNKKKNGNLYWESAIISPITNEQGEITNFISVKEDITSKKYQAEQLIKAKEQAEKSDKLKSEFIAQMSHEIRTPLNNILTYTSLIKDELDTKLPSGLEIAFDVIKSSANRLIRTIDLILNLSKVQSGNYDFMYEEINLKDFLYDIMLEFYTRAKNKKLDIFFKDESEKADLKNDKYLIGQIMINLLDNATKYTNKGNITIRLYNADNKICVDIMDTGIGISENFMENIFEPFTQEDYGATRNYEGIGLGLALVKKYTELCKAEIKVKSKKDEGTTFTILFNKK